MENNKSKMTIKTIAFWGVSALVLGGMIFGMVKIASRNPAGNSNGSLALTSAIIESDWVRGNREAKVIITEYSDFQCPACASYYEVMKMAHKDFGDDIAFVYRHFPLRQIHANAEIAALSAEAAGKQGKFWEMHDMIFENQKKWEKEKQKNAREIFTGYATELGLNAEQFKKDLDSNEVKSKVESDYQSGIKTGVNHTPTFFMNGKEIQNPRSYEEFKKIINDVASKK